MNDRTARMDFPSHADFLAELDIPAGWPPRIKTKATKKAAQSTRDLLKVGMGIRFDSSARRARVQAALRATEVRQLLVGRWSVLGVHRLRTLGSEGNDERVRVCIFNYTSNTLVDVFLSNGVVSEIVPGLPHQHPESAMEIAQAIAIARNHPELATRVKKLLPQGILRVPTHDTSVAKGHRCIELFFTEPNDPHGERPVLFFALVDLTLQQIVSVGSCGCSDKSNDDRKQQPKRR